MNELLEHLEKFKIIHSTDDGVLEIGGKACYICKAAGKVADVTTMKLLDFDLDFELQIFKFGGVWYYSESDELTLNRIEYMGECRRIAYFDGFLGVHGAMDILSGSRLYPDWVKKAKHLGFTSLGICEHNTMAGIVKFQLACKSGGITPIIGMSFDVNTPDGKLVLKAYVKDEIGWGNLLKINKAINITNGGFIDISELDGLGEGLFIVADVKYSKFEAVSKITALDITYTLEPVEFISTSVDNEYILNLQKFIESDLEPIAIYDAHYLEKDHAFVRELLAKIGKKTSTKRPTNQWFMGDIDWIQGIYGLPIDEGKATNLVTLALKNISMVVSGCNFTIPEMSPETRYLPSYNMTPEEIEKYGNSSNMLEVLVEEGLQKKIPVADHPQFRERIKAEFEVLDIGNVRDYFLTLWDVIFWARSKGIQVGIGRGSAAGSVIAYLTDITRVDPIEYDLLFERFLNPGRVQKSLPDIDVDFSGKRRGEVKEYIMSRYGEDQFCDVGTYTNLKPKSLIKEIGKIEYGFEHYILNDITKYWANDMETVQDIIATGGKDGRTKKFINDNPELINDCHLMLLQPKAESVHACATIIVPNDKTIHEYMPCKWMISGGKKTLTSQWEGPELEAVGFLKEDILGVELLDRYEMVINRIKEDLGEDLDLEDIPLNDHEVMEMFKRGDNADIFHFGSTGLTGFCKELKPDNINDLIAANSLYRPGPMEQGFHKQYVKRKNGIDDVSYLPQCEEITKDTYGVLCYQEQIMRICQHVGGLTLAEADSIRKAMVKKDLNAIGKFVDQFKESAINKWKIPSGEVDTLWETLLSFAKYAFNKCISGDDQLLMYKGNSLYHPTISEMYRLKNDIRYAKHVGKKHLHLKYKHLYVLSCAKD